MQAYLEWMPIRDATPAAFDLPQLSFGDLADLIMLDTRALRDRQVLAATSPRSPTRARTLLGEEQEAWLFDRSCAPRTRAAPPGGCSASR